MIFNWIIGLIAVLSLFWNAYLVSSLDHWTLKLPGVLPQIRNRFLFSFGFFLLLAYRLWG